jgi:hypothetical protein
MRADLFWTIFLIIMGEHDNSLFTGMFDERLLGSVLTSTFAPSAFANLG